MKRIIPFTAAAVIAAGMVTAETAPEDVVFGEYGEIAESLTGVAGDPAEGEKVMTSRGLGNCIACHQVTALEEYPFHGEVGPSLDGAGSRWDEAQLRGIVAGAKNTFPDSVMPSFYKSTGFIRIGDAFTGKAGSDPTTPLLTAQQIEDVVAYLMTLQD
ncbi:sulfur oxidation c-type cytochrome SoxX [Marivivens marinus]|uniref:sulfur oxidation c-type cytochrome SoxX n=1 Tax=Marivivens marinus TaxID=3110173 RepID=UPI003B8460A9